MPRPCRPRLISPVGQGSGRDLLPLAELKRRLEELRRRLPPGVPFDELRRVILDDDADDDGE